MRKILFIMMLLITVHFALATEFYVEHNNIKESRLNTELVASSNINYNFMGNTSLYTVFFKSNPTSGQVVYVSKNSSYITFQPMALNYRNDLNQLQQIKMVQAVTGVNDRNSFTYPAAYGAGINLTYVYRLTQIKESLILQNKSVIGIPTATLINGGNTTLDLDFIISASDRIFIDNSEWDKSSDKRTSNAVNIKDASGKIIYTLNKPYAIDSNGTIKYGYYAFKKAGNSLYVTIKINYSWLNKTAVYPVIIDPTTILQIESKAVYSEPGYDINATLKRYTNGAFSVAPNDIWIRNETQCMLINKSGICFGADDYTSKERTLYQYEFISTKMLDNEYRLLENITLINPTTSFAQYRQIDLSDICKPTSQCTHLLSHIYDNSSFKYSNLTVTFYADYDSTTDKVAIDPQYILVYNTSFIYPIIHNLTQIRNNIISTIASTRYYTFTTNESIINISSISNVTDSSIYMINATRGTGSELLRDINISLNNGNWSGGTSGGGGDSHYANPGWYIGCGGQAGSAWTKQNFSVTAGKYYVCDFSINYGGCSDINVSIIKGSNEGQVSSVLSNPCGTSYTKIIAQAPAGETLLKLKFLVETSSTYRSGTVTYSSCKQIAQPTYISSCGTTHTGFALNGCYNFTGNPDTLISNVSTGYDTVSFWYKNTSMTNWAHVAMTTNNLTYVNSTLDADTYYIDAREFVNKSIHSPSNYDWGWDTVDTHWQQGCYNCPNHGGNNDTATFIAGGSLNSKINFSFSQLPEPGSYNVWFLMNGNNTNDVFGVVSIAGSAGVNLQIATAHSWAWKKIGTTKYTLSNTSIINFTSNNYAPNIYGIRTIMITKSNATPVLNTTGRAGSIISSVPPSPAKNYKYPLWINTTNKVAYIGMYNETTYYTGQIDEVIFMNYNLTQAQITELYSGAINNSEYISKYARSSDYTPSMIYYGENARPWNLSINSSIVSGQSINISIRQGNQYNLTQGLIGLYAFDNDTLLYSKNLVNLSEQILKIGSNPLSNYSQGLVGKGQWFNGSMYLNSTVKHLTQSMSVWIAPGTTSGTIYNTWGNIYNPADAHFKVYYSGSIYFECIGSGVTNQISLAAIDNTKWNHLAIVKNRTTNKVSMYLNGGLITTKDYTGNCDYNDFPDINYLGVIIGGNIDNGQVITSSLIGGLDELRTYNYTLSADEVLQLYQHDAFEINWSSSWANLGNTSNLIVGSPSNFIQYKGVFTSNSTNFAPNVSSWTMQQFYSSTPSWQSGSPYNMTLNENQSVIQQINATDDEGILCYYLNDSRFTINCSGYMYNNTPITHSIIDLTVRAVDTEEYNIFANFSINMREILQPYVRILSPENGSEINATWLNFTAYDVHLESCWYDIAGTNITTSCTDGTTTCGIFNSSQTTCESYGDYGCSYNSGSCTGTYTDDCSVFGFDDCYYNNPTLCTWNSYCMDYYTSGVCYGSNTYSCSNYYNDCYGTPSYDCAQYIDDCSGTVSTDCSAYTNETDCTTLPSNSECEWNTTDCIKKSCDTWDADGTTCATVGCDWTSGETTCGADTGCNGGSCCYWDSGVCSQYSCDNWDADSTSCSSSGCSWNDGETSCNSDGDVCYWSSGTCYNRDCYYEISYSGESSCSKAGCYWSECEWIPGEYCGYEYPFCMGGAYCSQNYNTCDYAYDSNTCTEFGGDCSWHEGCEGNLDIFRSVSDLTCNDGMSTWNVYANDTIGNIGYNTTTFNCTSGGGGDTEAPTWVDIPGNATLEYKVDSLYADFNATDNVLVDSYFINDTTNFDIDSSGILTNKTTLAVGYYVINVSVNDTSNNIASLDYGVNVTKNIGSCAVYFNMSSPQVYPQTFRVMTNCTSDYSLFRNGTVVTNNSVQSLAVGFYNFTVYRADTVNYSNVNDTQFFTISKASPIIYAYINNSRSNLTVRSNDTINLSAELIQGESIINLYNNGSLINTGTSPLSNMTLFRIPGVYNITAEYPATENYTYSSEQWNLTVDHVIPYIEIISPTNKWYNSSSILVNISTIDAELVWWQNDSNNNISYVLGYYPFTDGTHTIIAYANSTSNDINSTSVIFYVDTTAPVITFIYPLNNQYYGASYTRYINISLSDLNPSNCTLDNSDWTLNYSNGSFVSFRNNTHIDDGVYSITVTCNDSLGNTGSRVLTFTYDSTNPFIQYTSNTLQNNSNASQHNVYVEVTFQESFFQNITYSIFNSSGDLYDEVTYIIPETSHNFTGLSDGTYTYRVSYIYDRSGNSNSTETRTITLDTVKPSLYIISPITDSIFVDSGVLFTVSGNENLLSCKVSTDNYATNYSLDRYNSTQFSAAIDHSNGAYTALFACSDMSGNENNISSTFSVNIPDGGAGGPPPGATQIARDAASNITKKTVGLNMTSTQDLLKRLLSTERVVNDRVCQDNEFPIISVECNPTLQSFKDLSVFRQIWILRLFILSSILIVLLKKKDIYPFIILMALVFLSAYI